MRGDHIVQIGTLSALNMEIAAIPPTRVMWSRGRHRQSNQIGPSFNRIPRDVPDANSAYMDHEKSQGPARRAPCYDP